MEADLLKNTIADGTQTKVVALGIGTSVSTGQLNDIASAPTSKNVIRVSNFTSLTSVEEQLKNASSKGRYSSFISE